LRQSPWIASLGGTPSGEAHLRVALGRQGHRPRTSQAVTGMKRERNLGLEERIRAKEIKKQKSNDKILVDAIWVASIGHETLII
jgi:hypothetical protein